MTDLFKVAINQSLVY